METVLDQLLLPSTRPPDREGTADEWIALRNPRHVTQTMVPDILRMDEARVGRRSYDEVITCFLGDDRRKPLRHTRARPNRWVCKLQVAFRDANTGSISIGFGSGLLIANRFVLTAAHVLMDPVKDKTGKFQAAIDAATVVVIPGLDGRGRTATAGRTADTMPFGWTYGTAFRTARPFRLAMRASGAEPKEFDYAVIRLAAPIGRHRFAAIGAAPLGYWGYPQHQGRTIMRVKAPESLKRVRVNAVGYPQDKCQDRPVGRLIKRGTYATCPVADLGSVPWYSFDHIQSAGSAIQTFSTLEMKNDVGPGMSGGPVWLRWKGVRNLIGILHACDPIKSKSSPFRGSLATKITDNVKRDIQAWII